VNIMKNARSTWTGQILAKTKKQSTAKGLMKGAATMFDVFGTTGPRSGRGSAQQDFQAIMRDFDTVSRDVAPAVRGAQGKR